ncbi:hypothetical protein [Streptomyces sp. SDr-06]|uniref:hypothetical protein n=1 Tax=Streptomyces sp. SDr-06 TaxID=2267702 RepID=UPI001CB8A910|nr:hypothetical protein [Streptomyces sp. SDr-06]
MLRVIYEAADLDPEMPVDVEETRGKVRIRLDRNTPVEDIAQALNPVLEELLAGAQWFQLWKGEIVSMDSPEDPREGGTVARLHRGPVVQEGPARSQDGEAHAG